MDSKNKFLSRFISLILSLCMLISVFPAQCFAEIHETVSEFHNTGNITENSDEAQQKSEKSNQDSSHFECVAYQHVVDEFSLLYDTFNAALHLSDGTEIQGLAFTDYETYFENDDGSIYYTAGFVGDVGENIPANASDEGLIIEDLDYADNSCGFVYAYETESFYRHCVIDGKYLVYGVNDQGSIEASATDFSREICDVSLGSLYSYDENRYLLDLNVGNYASVNGESLYIKIDFAEIEAEVNRNLANQDYNFSTQEIQTVLSFSQESVVSYLLSLQDETFMGYKVSELVQYASTLEPDELIRITPEGYEIINIENTSSKDAKELAKKIISLCCTASSIVLQILPATYAVSVIPSIVSAVMETAEEVANADNVRWGAVIAKLSVSVLSVFVPQIDGLIKWPEKVIKNVNVEHLNSLKCIAFSTVYDATCEYIDNKIDEDGNDDRITPTYIACLFNSIKTASIAEVTEKAIKNYNRIIDLLPASRSTEWLKKAKESTETLINNKKAELRKITETITDKVDSKLQKTALRKSIRQVLLAVNSQIEKTGGSYTELISSAQKGTEKHEIPAFSSIKDVYSYSDRNQAELPAIIMSEEDHRRTASHGSSNEAVKYRKKQTELISQGKFKEALQMDIDDITSKFGSKYTVALAQAIEYAESKEWWY